MDEEKFLFLNHNIRVFKLSFYKTFFFWFFLNLAMEFLHHSIFMARVFYMYMKEQKENFKKILTIPSHFILGHSLKENFFLLLVLEYILFLLNWHICSVSFLFPLLGSSELNLQLNLGTYCGLPHCDFLETYFLYLGLLFLLYITSLYLHVCILFKLSKKLSKIRWSINAWITFWVKH